MKIGGPSTLDFYEVNVPPEIIAQIIEYVGLQGCARMRTLWACCLLSRAWYEVAIVLLYQQPNISNKNFDKFARTMCPPVNAHVKRVGLEQLVRHLDMGQLAYESSRSLTARLIRRTRMSLEVFVAPATSFSVSSLAPLSKCMHLRVLDLSRDFNVIKLDLILRTINHLPIESLNLPKSALREPFSISSQDAGTQSWPVTLQHLGVNEHLPCDAGRWLELIKSLPSGLLSLSFDECPDWTRFWHLPVISTTIASLRTLSIALRRPEEGFPIDLLVKTFPSITRLFLPSPMTDLHKTTMLLPDMHERKLAELYFTRLPNAIRQIPALNCGFLCDAADAFPELRIVHLPNDYFKVADGDLDELDDLNARMAARVREGLASGIYLT